MTQTRYRFITALLLAVLLWGCARSPEARRDAFLAKGKTYMAKKDYARAIVEFKAAAGAMPKDPEPYYQAGIALLAAGDLTGGVRALRQTLLIDPNHKLAQLRMAQLTSMGDEDMAKDAEGKLEELLHGAPDDPNVLNALAFTELRLGKTGEAMDSLEKVLAHAPKALNVSVMLAKAKLGQKDVKGAEQILEQACEASPKSAVPRIVLGNFYESQNRNTDAEAQFKKALELEPKNNQAQLSLATLWNSLGRKQEAEDAFKRLAVSSDKTFKAVYALFLFEQGRKEEGVAEFERLNKQDPEDRLTRTRLVAAYLQVNRNADAERVIATALKKNPKDIDALLQRGEMSLTKGDYEKAKIDLIQVMGLQPNSAQVQYTLARIDRARGAQLVYRQGLFKTLQLDPLLLSARLELAQALVGGNEAKSALDVLDQTPSPQRQNLLVLVSRNWALWALGEFAEMRKGIDAGLARERSADLLIQDGLWKLNAGNANGARASVQEALKLDPSDLRALSALRQTYGNQKQSSEAMEKVKEYAAKSPKSAAVQEFLGMMLMSNGNKSQARDAFLQAKQADPKFVTADLSLIQLDAADGKLGDAQGKLQAMVTTDPKNTTAQLWLGNIDEDRGDHAAALEQFRKVVAADPENTQALNNLAYLLSEYKNNPNDALKFAESAQALAPDNPEFADTVGWILYRKGLYPSAVKQLERTLTHRGNVVWQYHLGLAYYKTGDVEHGKEVLQAALKRNPNVPEAKMALDVLGPSK